MAQRVSLPDGRHLRREQMRMTAVHPGERCEECREKLGVEGWL